MRPCSTMTVLRVFFFCALSGCMAFGAAGHTIQGLIATMEANQDDSLSKINISYPINEAIFPSEFPAPVFEWLDDHSQADSAFTVSVYGMNKDSGKIVSKGSLQLCISTDSVNAPIFYRDVPLPFQHTLENLQSLRWRLGDISKSSAPPVLLEEMKVCGNCHSFDSNGRTIGMDVDYGSDKGSYVIADIAPETVFSKDRVISWSDYRRGEGNR